MVDEESAGAVLHRWVDDEPRYLLLHYVAGHWGFPKGHIEAGETEVEALLREVEEETGIPRDRVDVLDGFAETVAYTYRRGDRLRDKEVHYRLAETDAEEVTLSREHQDWAWMGCDDAVERITYDDVVGVLEKADPVIRRRRAPR